MAKLKKVVINDRVFFKTTKSPKERHCVGVSVEDSTYFVVNTKEKNTIISFTKQEWTAFILGVKEGHFDNL